jgi:hypothetical protein
MHLLCAPAQLVHMLTRAEMVKQLSAFYAALLNTDLTGQVVKLPPGINFPNGTSEDMLYVRCV